MRSPLVILILGVAACTVARAEQGAVRVQREPPTAIVIRHSPVPVVHRQTEVVGDILKLAVRRPAPRRPQRTEVWLSVRTAAGAPIPLQNPRNLRIREIIDGQPRAVPPGAVTVEQQPLAVVLLRDVSASLGAAALSHSQRAIQAYVMQMQPGDRTALVVFSSQAAVVTPLTDQPARLNAGLRTPFLPLDTALYDAIVLGLRELTRLGERYRKALVVFTDGHDTASGRSLEETLAIAASSAIPIFTVGVGEADAAVLQQLSGVSRGLSFPARHTGELASIYATIAALLRTSSVISYPVAARAGETVHVEITAGGSPQDRVIFYGVYTVP